MLGFLGIHMVNHAIGEILLPLRTLLLISSLIWIPGETILIHVAWQSTLETHTKSLTSLRGSILLVRGCRMRNLLYILPRLLLLGMEHCIFRMLHLKFGMLHQKLGTLVLELWTQNMHQCMAQKGGSDKLTGL
jgi:hypothetical protein